MNVIIFLRTHVLCLWHPWFYLPFIFIGLEWVALWVQNIMISGIHYQELVQRPTLAIGLSVLLCYVSGCISCPLSILQINNKVIVVNYSQKKLKRKKKTAVVLENKNWHSASSGQPLFAAEVKPSVIWWQVTGEAEYTDDVPTPPNGLHAALILSKKPHARILAIDDSVAKSSTGFAGIFFAKHVPGINMVGPVVVDEELFASEVVTCVGQVISNFFYGWETFSSPVWVCGWAVSVSGLTKHFI